MRTRAHILVGHAQGLRTRAHGVFTCGNVIPKCGNVINGNENRRESSCIQFCVPYALTLRFSVKNRLDGECDANARAAPVGLCNFNAPIVRRDDAVADGQP